MASRRNPARNVPAEPFLLSRERWLRVETIERDHGGWDVVRRIDGTYTHDDALRAQMVDYFSDWLAEELDCLRAEHPDD